MSQTQLKGIALLVCLLVLVVQRSASQWSDICAFETDGTRLPLPTDCRRFVLCLEREVAEIRTCPRGLHFNRKQGECDFQWRADCTGLSLYASRDANDDEECVCTCCEEECKTTEDVTTPCYPPEQETTTQSPDSPTDDLTTDGTFSPDETDQPGDPTGSPTKTTSKPAQSTTNSPQSSTNSPQTTSSPVNPDGPVPTYCSNKRTDCVNKLDGAMVPIAGECSKYIQCSHGCCVEQTCPSGLYFNFKTNECDFFYNVDCVPDNSADADGEIVGPSGTTCTDQSVCARKRDGKMFADPTSNGYIVCQCQCPIAMPCDPQTKFNETAQVCDWDRSAPSAVNVLCPDGLVYNATSDQCDYPEGYVPKVECSNTVTLCQGQPEGTLFPMEGVCNKFYKCNYNCAVEQICPNNLVYDTNYKLCNYRQDYDCPWEYTPPTGPDAGPSGISCDTNGRCLNQLDGTTFNSLTSCSGYVVCQCECEVDMQCKDGLYWNQKLQTCDWESNVSCTL